MTGDSPRAVAWRCPAHPLTDAEITRKLSRHGTTARSHRSALEAIRWSHDLTIDPSPDPGHMQRSIAERLMAEL